MLRASILALLLFTSVASAEGVTLEELNEGGIIKYNGDILLCKPWAMDLSDKEPQTLVVADEGRVKFYWSGSWAGRNEFKHYESLDNHHLIAKTDGETGKCTIQVFKF